MKVGVVLSDVPAMVGHSLETSLTRRDPGVRVATSVADWRGDDPFVEVVRCFQDETGGWTRMRHDDRPNRVGFIALIDQHRLEMYERAFRLGASVIHLDSDPEIACDVILARSRGDIVAPAGIVTAALSDSLDSLLPSEELVLVHLAEGRDIVETATITSYSERHVRRLLRSIMVKAGTSDRQRAIEYFRPDSLGLS